MTDNNGNNGKTPPLLSSDIKFLGGLLGRIIAEQHGDNALDLVEDIRHEAKERRAGNQEAERHLEKTIVELDLPAREILVKAFSNYFQLINIAEDQERIRVLRGREAAGNLNDAIPTAVDTLKKAGLTAEQVRALLDKLSIRLVITAHPSEAKRKHVLVKLRDITRQMNLHDRQNLLPREEETLEALIAARIEELWQTRPNRLTQTTVMDEVNNSLYFLTQVIMHVSGNIYDDLRHSLQKYYPEADWSGLPPILRYASWVGGDRDGNPNVTADVTLNTLKTLRTAARTAYIAQLEDLYQYLTQSAEDVGVSDAVREWLRGAEYLSAIYPGELYRQMCRVIIDRLHHDAYSGPELIRDLSVMDESLRTHHGGRVAVGALRRLLQKIRLFGLHIVPLDIREDARLHTEALNELFAAYDIESDYTNLSEADKQALLTREIASTRPLFPLEPDFSETTNRIIATWRMIAEAHHEYGPMVIDSVIASHTEAPSDVLTMLLFAREVRVSDHVDIVPLFETIGDLDSAAEVMRQLLTNPAYQAHLTARKRHQQIMLGYSDSGKDGGYIASNWGLFVAEQRLAELAQQEGISLELFHGRGGSIGRGGGPTRGAILSQPPDAIASGRIKITEQGEVIAYRYSNEEIARRHLHQVIHAVLIAVGHPPNTVVQQTWRDAMAFLAERGKQAFQALVYHTDGFLDYWQQATPINELAHMPISSRPTKRKKAGGFEDVRAIPWVFSWMQSRAIIPSWYGVGTALEGFIDENPDGLQILQAMYQEWPFFTALVENTQLDLAKADMGIAGLYASLVEDATLRESIFGRIQAEHTLATAVICRVLDQPEILANSPVIKLSIERRNPYIDPLNFIQVATLREIRAMKPDDPRYGPALRVVLSTINGIAAGMKTTG